MFTDRPIADIRLVAGSAKKQRIARISVLRAPFVADFFAEGTFEVTLPVRFKLHYAV